MGHSASHLTGDPMTTQPRRHAHNTNPRTKDDISGVCYITSITTTPNGSLVMADTKNRMVKVIPTSMPRETPVGNDDQLCSYVSLGEPSPPQYDDEQTLCLVLLEQPCDLATMQDGEVAVTTDTNIIYFISVGSQIVVKARQETQRRYWGVAAHTDGTLVVSSCRDEDNGQNAYVDIIDKTGLIIWTVEDGANVSWLKSPYNLCVFDNHVFIAEYFAHKVYKVDVQTGELVETLTHAEMRTPRQICVDARGNLFIASEYGQCILVRSPLGEWRKLLTVSDHSRHGFDCPSGVCLTHKGGLIVAWTKTSHNSFESELVGYQL